MNDAAFWMGEARRRFDVALLLFEGGHYPEAISRALYVMYAVARALLTSKAVHTRTHPGLKAVLSRLYVRAGLLDRSHIRAYDQAFKDRMIADYDGKTFSQEQARQRLEQARHFIEAAEQLLA